MTPHEVASLRSRNDELEHLVAHYKRELGLARNLEHEERLQRRFHLTGKEARMLSCMLERDGAVISKGGFLDALYGGVDEPEVKIIDVFVCKIRRKAGAGLIETIWGKGYCLTPAGLAACRAIVQGEEPPPIPPPPTVVRGPRGLEQAERLCLVVGRWLVKNGEAEAKDISAGVGFRPRGRIHNILQSLRKMKRVEKVGRAVVFNGRLRGSPWRLTELGRTWVVSQTLPAAVDQAAA